METAGDCYIVAGGLLNEDEDGFQALAKNQRASAYTTAARRVLNFAYKMMQVPQTVRMPNNGQPVRLRAGIHSGPVVSGLIGQAIPKFSLL